MLLLEKGIWGGFLGILGGWGFFGILVDGNRKKECFFGKIQWFSESSRAFPGRPGGGFLKKLWRFSQESLGRFPGKTEGLFRKTVEIVSREFYSYLISAEISAVFSATPRIQ